FFVELSIIEDGDPGNSSMEVLLVLIVERVLHCVKELGLELDDSNLKEIYGWFDETFEVKESELRFNGGAGGGVDSTGSLWGKMLGLTAFLKAGIRTGSGVLSTSISREQKRLPQLAHQCGLLIREVQLALSQQHSGKELLLIVEDLDKVTVGEADQLFIENPAPLAGLPLKAILTAPVFLLCSPRAVVLESRFKVVTLPMIKVCDRKGERDQEGWKTICSILDQRIDYRAQISDEALDLAISKTGGVLRHLFVSLQQAAASTIQAVNRGLRGEQRIEVADVRYGLNRLRSDLLRRIGVIGLPPEFAGITTEQLYQRLQDLASKRQRAVSDRINLLLLQAHSLLEYNGEQWHCVHPLVAEHIEESM
ncbi:MAG: hypothetical protein GY842_24860, partial [bacterium]|nr:hypothetical protein [bacterium]